MEHLTQHRAYLPSRHEMATQQTTEYSYVSFEYRHIDVHIKTGSLHDEADYSLKLGSVPQGCQGVQGIDQGQGVTGGKLQSHW